MDIHIVRIPYWLLTLAAVGASAVGLWRGGRDGAVVAVMVLGQFALGWWAKVAAVTYTWQTATILDVTALAVCLYLVLTGRRYWMIWVAAAQVLSVVTEALRHVPGVTVWAYYSAQIAWGLVLDVALVLGPLLNPSPWRGAGNRG